MGRRPQARPALGELHSPVEAVVVREGEGVLAQLPRLEHQLQRRGRPLKEGTVGAQVEFGVPQVRG